MKNKIVITALVLNLIMTSFLFADRTLEKSEITAIVENLTSSSRQTWIPQGTIEATLQSFSSKTNCTMESKETIKYDGNRFYWEINILSDTADNGHRVSASRSKRDAINTKRIFIWDGQWYSMYFVPVRNAISAKSSTEISPKVTGCLTAGVIPWGYGIYSRTNLLDSGLDAEEVSSEGQTLIHLTVKNANGMELFFVLDPAKNYAVLSSSIKGLGDSCILQEYSNYVLTGGQWVPSTILIERYSDCKKTEKLVSYDYWVFDHVDSERPQDSVFNVSYEDDTLIEYHPDSRRGPLFCQYSSRVNAKDLLNRKLATLNSNTGYSRNCATSVLKYVIESLGKSTADSNLAVLVDRTSSGTSLLAMQQFVNNMGLYSLAAKMDVQTLSNNTANYKPILYLPWSNHYVVFSHIENNGVWVIDLSNDRFCHSIPLEKFTAKNANSIVLFVSDKPVSIRGAYTTIPERELLKIVGSSGSGFGTYSCTELIQAYDIIFCPEPLNYMCMGEYTVFWNRYGCKEDNSGGECTGTGVVGSLSSPCINDPYYPDTCDTTGYWYADYMRACK